MLTDDEIKPCPFCGINLTANTNQANLYVRRYGTYYAHAIGDCYLSEMEVSPGEVEEWNSRAIEAATLASSSAAREDAEPDHIAPALAEAHASPRIQWPADKAVGRAEDMGDGYLRLVLDSDNDVCVAVWDGKRSASVEFCNPGGGGGGRSSRTRMALIALMVAIEADNDERPDLQRPERDATRSATQGDGGRG